MRKHRQSEEDELEKSKIQVEKLQKIITGYEKVLSTSSQEKKAMEGLSNENKELRDRTDKLQQQIIEYVEFFSPSPFSPYSLV